jgi:hypothetical protein
MEHKPLSYTLTKDDYTGQFSGVKDIMYLMFSHRKEFDNRLKKLCRGKFGLVEGTPISIFLFRNDDFLCERDNNDKLTELIELEAEFFPNYKQSMIDEWNPETTIEWKKSRRLSLETKDSKLCIKIEIPNAQCQAAVCASWSDCIFSLW